MFTQNNLHHGLESATCIIATFTKSVKCNVLSFHMLDLIGFFMAKTDFWATFNEENFLETIQTW